MVSLEAGQPLPQALRAVRQQLEAAGCPDAAYDARVLVRLATGKQSPFDREALTEAQAARLTTLAARRCAREPLQYICGEWPFLNFVLAVGPGVLCPRPDTELLVQCAAACLGQRPAPVVLDLCAGTGCVGLGVKSLRPEARVTCVEKESAAFSYLVQNAARALPGLPVAAVQGDLFSFWRQLAPESLDLLTANPPYLTAQEMNALQPETAREPSAALDGGEDGLSFYRALARDYRPAVKPGGWLAVEIGYQQRQAVCALLAQNGWQRIRCEKDLGGQDRCVLAQRPL